MARRLGVEVDPAHVAACVGTKELVAGRAAVAAPAATRPRHRALPGDQLPDLRDGRHARRLPGGARTGDARRHRSRRRRPGPVPLGERARQPHRRARRPRRGGRVGPRRAACRCSPTSATWSSPGTGRRARSSSTAPTACSPCTRCRSARTWPAPGPASTPATPSSSRYLAEVRKHAGFMVPGPGAGRRGRGVGRRRPRRRAARALPAPARRDGHAPWPRPASTPRSPTARSTCGLRRPTATRGAWPGASPRRRRAGVARRVLRTRRRRLRAGGGRAARRPHRPRGRTPRPAVVPATRCQGRGPMIGARPVVIPAEPRTP